MVQTASQRTPDIICGKPHKPMLDVIVAKYNIEPKKTLMIGDRYGLHVFIYLLVPGHWVYPPRKLCFHLRLFVSYLD